MNEEAAAAELCPLVGGRSARGHEALPARRFVPWRVCRTTNARSGMPAARFGAPNARPGVPRARLALPTARFNVPIATFGAPTVASEARTARFSTRTEGFCAPRARENVSPAGLCPRSPLLSPPGLEQKAPRRRGTDLTSGLSRRACGSCRPAGSSFRAQPGALCASGENRAPRLARAACGQRGPGCCETPHAGRSGPHGRGTIVQPACADSCPHAGPPADCAEGTTACAR